MDDGIRRVNQPVVCIAIESELRRREVADKNSDARLQVFVKARKVHVQLHGLPQANFRVMRVFTAHQQVESCALLVEKIGRHMGADVSGGTGQEYRHVAPLVPVGTVSAPLGASGAICSVRGGRASSGRPSIKG